MSTPRVTIETVAAAAGVSRMTVSYVYNRPERVSDTTRAKVLAAAKAVGYHGPNPSAQSFRRGRTNTVGVVLTEALPYSFTDPGMSSVLRGMAQEIYTAGYALTLMPSDAEGADSLVRRVLVDGLVLCSLDAEHPAVTAALERRIPVVTIGTPKLPGVPRVSVDNAAAARDAARHLIDLGHRRCAVLDVSLDALGRVPGRHERAGGFAAAFESVPHSQLDRIYAAENARAAGAAAVTRFLADTARQPTAIFAVTDVLALGALDAANQLGTNVPGHLSIVGFDGIDDSATSSPALTTVAQSLPEQGRAAAQILLKSIRGDAVRSRTFPAELIVRASTAKPRRQR